MGDSRNMPLYCILPKVHTTLKFITINVSSTYIHACMQLFMWMYICVCMCLVNCSAMAWLRASVGLNHRGN